MKKLLLTAVILVAAGTIATFAGALFKLQHWEGGPLLLISGMLLQVMAIICFAVFFITKVRKTGSL